MSQTLAFLNFLIFQMLTKCCLPTNWCLSELVQASIILAQTHVLCSFVLGNGIVYPNGHIALVLLIQ